MKGITVESIRRKSLIMIFNYKTICKFNENRIIRSMIQAEDITFTHYVSGLPVYKVNTKEILK